VDQERAARQGAESQPSITPHGDRQIRPGTLEELVPGMIFTIEPMINAGKRHVKLLPDGWTVVTKDHSLSAQWEHTVLVTETGYEVLTHSAGSPPPPAFAPEGYGSASAACLSPPALATS
jgi:methionyl aminopeptidase